MLEEIFKALLIASLAGSALACIITVARPITKKIFGYSWHYYIWLAVLVTMLLPVRFNFLQNDSVSIFPLAKQTSETVQMNDVFQTNTAPQVTQTVPKTTILKQGTELIKRILDNKMTVLIFLWLLGAVIFFTVNLVGYIRLLIKMRKNSVVIAGSEIKAYTNKKIDVRIWESLSSPFMAGIFRPTLVLPSMELTNEQLSNILRHEMTHFKRHDILYKWFAVIVRCMHWFNPVVWYVTKQISIECEISCDLSVVERMNKEEETSYINTILTLLSRGKAKSIPLTTGMTGSKKVLKRRFMMIKNKKATSKFVSVLSAVIAVVMLSTTVFASGVLTNSMGVYGEYRTEIYNGEQLLDYVNKPFIENDEVYLPLRETFEKFGATDSIIWDNGKITVRRNPKASDNSIATIDTIFEIGKKDVTMRHFQGKIFPEGKFTYNTQSAPILKNSVTYIPYEYFQWLRIMHKTDDDNSNLGYVVYDKNNAEISRMFSISETSSHTYELTSQFFSYFEKGDYENMKTLCTAACAEKLFNDDGFYGMKVAQLGTVYSIYPGAKITNNTKRFVSISVYKSSRSEEFEKYDIVFDKQADGIYLMEDFYKVQ